MTRPYQQYGTRCIRHRLTSAFCIFSVFFSLLITACTPNQNEPASQNLENQLEVGINELQAFNFNEAHRILLEYCAKLSPEDDTWTLAHYSLALATWHQSPASQQSTEDAREQLKTVIDQAPSDPLAAFALLDLGRIAESANTAESNAEALKYYQRIQNEYPDSDTAVRASLLHAKLLASSFQEESAEAAIRLLIKTVENHPNTQWAGTIEQYIAHLYAFYLDDIEQSIPHYLAAEKAGFPRPSEADLSLWQLGLFQQTANQPIAAAETFTKIVKEYPRSVYGTFARERIIMIAQNHPEADLEIPDLSEVKLGR